MPEGYEGQPPQEAFNQEGQLSPERIESAGVPEQPVFRIRKNEGGLEEQVQIGIERVDDYGRPIFRREKWNEDKDEVQEINIKYLDTDGVLDNGGAIEYGEMTAGPERGKKFTREHPMSSHELPVFWEDMDIGTVHENVPVILEAVSQTTAGGKSGGNEPWAHFECTDREELEVFADVTPKLGTTCGTLRGILSQALNFEVNGRSIQFDPISKISVDFGPDGMPVKATFHCYGWRESPAVENQTTK